MGNHTHIQWTEATWNPWHGCHKISPACKFCYMFRDKARYGQDPNVVVRSKTTFNDPLKWVEGRMIFTCSWSDFFIAEADEWRAEAWDIIRRTPQHTYQILTKRPERMASCLPLDWGTGYANVWLGISAENQLHFDERWPHLRNTPAAVRWLSLEPLLGGINLDLARCLNGHGWVTPVLVNNDKDWGCPICFTYVNGLQTGFHYKRPIDWVVVGGESGAGARPMHPDWARSLRDQCNAADMPFFFKQHGEYIPLAPVIDSGLTPEQEKAVACADPSKTVAVTSDGKVYWKDDDDPVPGGIEAFAMSRVGTKNAGRMLDGRTWDEFPMEAARNV